MSIFLSSQKIIKDWIDYNNHLNVSYYLLIFDKYGADVLNDKFRLSIFRVLKQMGARISFLEKNLFHF